MADVRLTLGTPAAATDSVSRRLEARTARLDYVKASDPTIQGTRRRLIAALIRAASPIAYPSAAGTASVVPLCETNALRPQRLYSGLGVLESVLVDHRGRLFVSSQTWDGSTGAVVRIDHPGATPVPLVREIDSPGGLALDPQGRLLVGFGDNFRNALLGNMVGRARLLSIDPDNGHRCEWVTGLGQANGVVCAKDGTVFTTSDLGTHIERIDSQGNLERRWAAVWSANGLAIDPTGRYLYAAQTFGRAAIRRIEIDHPANVTTYASPRWPAAAALLDGMAIDSSGRLYVAANAAGQIWQVDTEGRICALARGLRFPSAVALGRGNKGFHAGALYAVTFNGEVVAVPIQRS